MLNQEELNDLLEEISMNKTRTRDRLIIDLPLDVKIILNKLNDNGFESYVVGGCVRDAILNKIPNDWDICTNASPVDTMNIFKDYNIIPTGLKHGTVTVIVNGGGYEITTYRVDGEYANGRHPNGVTFVNSLKEDLNRRDLTINAMAYNESRGLVDPFGGLGDLLNRLLRCVGHAQCRFNEDALRILRTLRFASTLGFDIEGETSKALLTLKKELRKISSERVSAELLKIMQGRGAYNILMDYREVIAVIIPEIKPMFNFEQNSPYHKYTVWEHTVHAVCASKGNYVCMAALLHDIGKPLTYTEKEGIGHFYGHAKQSAEISEKVCTRLRFSTEDKQNILCLVGRHDITVQPTKKFVLKHLNTLGEERFRALLALRVADIMGQGVKLEGDDRLDRVNQAIEILDGLNLQEECFTLKQLEVTGHDLLKMGFEPGKIIGIILRELLKKVVEEELINDHVILKNYIVSTYGPNKNICDSSH